MSINGIQLGVSCRQTSSNCLDQFGCPPNVCPDFTIKRHDTKPPFKVAIEDCDGAFDLSEKNLIAEINMWAKAKLRRPISRLDTQLSFADNIGFNQVMVGDIIEMERIRLPEQMLVVGFNESENLVNVQRGYNGTPINEWGKGQSLRIFRAMNYPAEMEVLREDIIGIDGKTEKNKIVDSFLVFEWNNNVTCLPGCYWLEFKLLKLMDSQKKDPIVENATIKTIAPISTISIISTISTISIIKDYGCNLGTGIDWVRRFPVNGEGFLIKIVDSPTREY